MWCRNSSINSMTTETTTKDCMFEVNVAYDHNITARELGFFFGGGGGQLEEGLSRDLAESL